MKEKLFKFWRVLKKPLLVLVLIYAVMVIVTLPTHLKNRKAVETIVFIESQRIEMRDVTGENLPPEPDPNLVDATIEGIDANNNWIRDDVELEIFKRYPNDAVIRSAMLQYAMALQLELTQVFNTKTYISVLEQQGRADSCISDKFPIDTLWFETPRDFFEWAAEDPKNEEVFNQEFRKSFNASNQARDLVHGLVFNTKDREKKEEDNFNKFMSSHGSDPREDCDIDPLLLK